MFEWSSKTVLSVQKSQWVENVWKRLRFNLKLHKIFLKYRDIHSSLLLHFISSIKFLPVWMMNDSRSFAGRILTRRRKVEIKKKSLPRFVALSLPLLSRTVSLSVVFSLRIRIPHCRLLAKKLLSPQPLTFMEGTCGRNSQLTSRRSIDPDNHFNALSRLIDR